MIKKVFCCVAALLILVSVPTFAVEQQQNKSLPEVLTLQQCLDLAMQNNKQIQEAKKQVEIAENAVKEAKAGFWPTVQYQVVRDRSDLPQYQVATTYAKTDFKFGINATLPPLYRRNSRKQCQIGRIAIGGGQGRIAEGHPVIDLQR